MIPTLPEIVREQVPENRIRKAASNIILNYSRMHTVDPPSAIARVLPTRPAIPSEGLISRVSSFE